MKVVGIGTRILNFLIDTLIIVIITKIILKINNFYELQFKAQHLDFPYQFNPGYTFFVVIFVYYFLCELFFKRTLGKVVSYTKVVSSNKSKPNIFQILLRSLLRLTVIDMFFFPFFEKTLHDKLSNTDVIEI